MAQETFRRALSAKRRPASLTLDAVRPWMFTILRNHWHNEMRQRRRNVDVDFITEIAVADTPESMMQRRFLQSEVRDAVDALPPAFREVIVLREIEGLSYSEMAALLNCPIGTVMSRLARARGLLRSMFESLAPAAPRSKAAGR